MQMIHDPRRRVGPIFEDEGDDEDDGIITRKTKPSSILW